MEATCSGRPPLSTALRPSRPSVQQLQQRTRALRSARGQRLRISASMGIHSAFTASDDGMLLPNRELEVPENDYGLSPGQMRVLGLSPEAATKLPSVSPVRLPEGGGMRRSNCSRYGDAYIGGVGQDALRVCAELLSKLLQLGRECARCAPCCPPAPHPPPVPRCAGPAAGQGFLCGRCGGWQPSRWRQPAADAHGGGHAGAGARAA